MSLIADGFGPRSTSRQSGSAVSRKTPYSPDSIGGDPPTVSPSTFTQPPSYTTPLPGGQTASTWKKFSIQSKTNAISSGFPYDDRLESLNVSHDQWFQFGSEVVNAANITFKEDYLAWTTGISAGTLSSPLTLIFAPWVGYYAGRALHRKTIEKKVQKELVGQGDIRTILQKWNGAAWADKGFSAWLQLPDDPKEERPDGTKSKKRRFRILLVPIDGMGQSSLPATQSSWSVNGSSEPGTPLAEVPGREFEPPRELQSTPLQNPPLPPPAFSAAPTGKSAAYTTSQHQRTLESTSGGSGGGGESTSEETKPGKIDLVVVPSGTTQHGFPGVRSAAELP